MSATVNTMRGDNKAQKSYLNGSPLECANDEAHCLQIIASIFDDYCTDLPQDYSNDASADEASSSDEKTTPSKCNQCRNCGSEGSPNQTATASAQPKRGVCRKIRKGSNGSVKDKKTPASQAQCVSRIEGPLMSLWPTPVEQLDLE